MSRRRRRGGSPYYRFDGLAGSLVKQGLFTEEEVKAIVEAARQDGTTNDIWETSLTALIREANERLAKRGSKYGRV